MSSPLDRVEAIRAERDRYVSLAFSGADMLFELDRELTIAFVAGPSEAFFGRKRDELVGVSFAELIQPVDQPTIGQMMTQLLRGGRLNDEIVRIIGPVGTMLRVVISGYSLDPDHGHLFVGLRRLTPAAKSLLLNPPRDESGMYDSANFAELAANRVKRVQAAGEEAMVTMLSISTLAEIKDKLDPQSGETVLRSVGEFLKANSLAGDSVAKVTDGQFSILHTAEANIEEVSAQVEAIIRRTDPSVQDAKIESTTMVVEADANYNEEDLAKGLLYVMSKFREKSGEHIDLKSVTDNMSTLIAKARDEVSAFKRIVQQSEFFVALQPIIQVTSGEIHHFEALCRFERNAEMSPFETITFAEETGLIHEFDLAMARKVVDWLSKVPRNNDKYRVAVNISGYSISQESYVKPLLEMLEENEWMQGKLMFEITESSRMSDLDHANKFFQELRDRGYHVCLDDFGAGAASFQYLSVLDVDVVKVDGSAVKNAQKAPKGRAFLSALTELCRRMNVETIAEMVDTPESLEFCRDCGCNYVQGYLFGKPSREVKDFTPLPQVELFRRTRRPNKIL